MRKLLIISIIFLTMTIGSVHAYTFQKSGYLRYHEIMEMPPSGCYTIDDGNDEWVLAMSTSIPPGIWGEYVTVYGDFESGITPCLNMMSMCCVTVDSIVVTNFQNPPNNVPLSSPATVVLIALAIIGLGFAAYRIRMT